MPRRFDIFGALAGGSPAALDMPCVVIVGRDADTVLAAASQIVASAAGETDPFGPMPIRTSEVTTGVGEEVMLPQGQWGCGRRVAVQARYSRGGSLLVTVPPPAITPARAGSTAHAMAAAAAESFRRSKGSRSGALLTDDDDHGVVVIRECNDAGYDCFDVDSETGWSSRQHAARCAGVLEVAKEAARRWNVSMTRRIVLLHMVCRLTRQVQSALRVVVENGHDKVLFVMTCTKQSALDECIRSRALVVPAPGAFKMPAASGRVRDPMVALAAGRLTPLGVMNEMLLSVKASSKKKKQTQQEGDFQEERSRRIVEACAMVDHTLSHLVSIGGDPVDGREAASRLLGSMLHGC